METCFNFKLFPSDFDDESLIDKSCGSSNVESVEDLLEKICPGLFVQVIFYILGIKYVTILLAFVFSIQ